MPNGAPTDLWRLLNRGRVPNVPAQVYHPSAGAIPPKGTLTTIFTFGMALIQRACSSHARLVTVAFCGGRGQLMPLRRLHTTKPSAPARGEHTMAGGASSSGGSARAMGGEVAEVEVDGMERRPSLTSAKGLLRTLDYVGTVSFAHSGTILAASMGMDLLGCAAVGTITAVGGGTIRDAVFLSKAPFWTEEVEYLALCVATALGTFALWPMVGNTSNSEVDEALFVGDTLGVAAFSVIGVQNGIRAGMKLPVSILCGMATATFGGAVRDVLCKRDVRIFHSHAEIYASTAAAGASAYLAAKSLRLPVGLRIAAGLSTAASLRYAARKNGIRLPTWMESPTPPAK